MANGLAEDKAWADKFEPLIFNIMGTIMVRPANISQDRKYNCDYKAEPADISCRIRRYKHFQRFGDEFTIRMSRPNGSPSELRKLMMGYGDFCFYAYANEDESGFHRWTIIDLHALRDYLFTRLMMDDKLPGIVVPAGDNSAEFLSLKLSDLPPNVIVGTGP